ncbi:mthfr-prov protein [Capsaspora owczarzaki ATCC 30864]|nr:mthfr-prov protein [Capsaspora owczarzaki ATCC 30864]|eukprot:XP_004343584.1 mthfr-prov protein [Capsaspora owczarzaki ATCC 30864]
MTVASTALNLCGLETMLHMTCANQTKAQLTETLQRAKNNGIRNILTLRGDPAPGEGWKTIENGFGYATDLVKHVRDTFGDYFGICVAGYPNGHPEAKSLESDLQHLKEKVDAGAEFIITQLFFDVETFFEFVRKCRAIGIKVPIIPGVLPIQGYSSLRNLVKLSNLQPPQYILDTIEPIKDDDEAIRRYGVHLATNMCRELLDRVDEFGNRMIQGVHFYTLNREVAVREILLQLGLWSEGPRSLPWKTSANERRSSEDVRPIFWSCRPKSYLLRTQEWDDFPNGRWGDSSSPAFGELTDYYLFHLQDTDDTARKEMWGRSCESIADIITVFTNYLSGKGNVQRLPWNEEPIAPETRTVLGPLIRLNERGVLTINSQPRVNGLRSDDPTHGWGGPRGYVYQKAYLEFFIASDRLPNLLRAIDAFPSVQYHAVNYSGTEDLRNLENETPTAVTWGVFPGKEIVQPTVVDPISFGVWKDEAFALWKTQWGSLYPPESPSRKFLSEVHDTFYLVNLVDNDFVAGNIYDVFDMLFELEDAAAVPTQVYATA